MKTLLTFLSTVLLFSLVPSSYALDGNFSIRTNKDTVSNIKSGELATFNINIIIQNGFDATLNFSYEAPSLDGAVTLSHTQINHPYQGVTLTIKPKDWHNYTDSKYHRITITAKNGSISTSTNCYVSIISRIAPSWKIMSAYERFKFVAQDNDAYYCNSFIHVGEDGLSTGVRVLFGDSQDKYALPEVLSMVEDSKKRKWFATYQGLFRYDGIYTSQFNSKNSLLPDNTITAIVTDNNETVWVGTNKGLTRISGTQWTMFDTTNSVLGKEPITSLAIHGSIVWVGTRNGLAKYDGSSWQRFTQQNSTIPAPFVWGIATEANGTLWLGLGDRDKYDRISTFNGPGYMIGLAKFDGISWKLYNNQNSPMNGDNYINSIAIDKKGNKWIATSSYLFDDGKIIKGSGLLKFNDSTWTTYSMINSPLPNLNVQWVGTDRDDNIWFSTYRECGVFNENGLPPFLAPSDVEELPDTQSGTITITPNPSSTTITISGTDAISAVTIVNSFGMEVVGKQTLSSANGSLNVDVSDLASGVYFVQLRTPTGMISKPIVVMH